MEEGHERVQDGKILHERAYKNAEQRELVVDDSFRIDVLDGEYVREVKLTSKMSDADKYQLLFYLYQLKKRGLVRKGLISYTKEKKTEELVLSKSDEKEIDRIIGLIEQIIKSNEIPPLLNKPYCKKCAYYDFCYADETEEAESR